MDPAMDVGGLRVHHDIHTSFGPLLRDALRGIPVAVALGPIYEKDPAAEILAPFKRSALETEWNIADERDLAPEHVLREARSARIWAMPSEMPHAEWLDDWTRAGLVLEIARRRGIRVKGRGTIHVPWKLKGTVTGRFGTEPVRGVGWTFNPLSLGPDDRWRIESAQDGGEIAVIDFRAMDLCSMVAIVPGLKFRYRDEPTHEMTAQLTGLPRDVAKLELFVHAYGGNSQYGPLFDDVIPELKILRSREHGEGARMVQTVSAQAFRAALSTALPLLIDDTVRPLFTVHDELTLDASGDSTDQVRAISKAMEVGASQRIGVSYRTALYWGTTYAEATE